VLLTALNLGYRIWAEGRSD